MEYRDITPSLIDELNEAVRNDSGRDFFEALGFDVYDCEDGRWELSGIHTKGGVEMIVMVDKESWIASFEEYYECFDVDEEIRIHREDPFGSYELFQGNPTLNISKNANGIGFSKTM